MPEQGPSRSPEELTGETLGSLGIDAPSLTELSEEYTWQQLEAAARQFEREANDLELAIEAIRQRQASLHQKAGAYRGASELAMKGKETDQL